MIKYVIVPKKHIAHKQHISHKIAHTLSMHTWYKNHKNTSYR